MLANVIGMGIFVNIYYVATASAIYPGADLPTTVIIGLILNLLVGYVYWMLATAMPRTGGDYVYVSRIFHPAIGFMANLMFVTIVTSWIGLYPPLASTQGIYTALVNLSIVTGSPVYGNMAPWFSTQAAQFVVGGLIVAMTMLIMFLPVRWIFRIVAAIFFVQLGIVIWFVAALLPVTHAQFISAFDSKFGVTAAQLISVASNQGVSYNITMGATMIGVVYTMLSYIGYANSSYFAGELKGNPKSSQGLAIMISPIIFAIIIYFEYYLSYQVFGHDFLVATNTIAGSTNSAVASFWFNSTSAPPTPAYFVSFISNNPIFVVAVPLGLILTYVGFAIVYMFIPIRQAFAYAFDRVIPTKFATVNSKGVPWVAVLLFGFMGYVFLYLTVYTNVLSYLGYTNFGWWLAVAIVMFAGASFPYVHKTKDIFDTAPDLIRKRIASIPLITILGVIAGILSLWVSYSAILPSFTGAPMNPIYVAGIMVVFVIALIIYGASYIYHKSKGLPLDLISKELPPV